jgi:hypothetical protein
MMAHILSQCGNGAMSNSPIPFELAKLRGTPASGACAPGQSRDYCESVGNYCETF